MTASRKPRKTAAPVLQLVSRRESAAGALSDHQMMLLEHLDELRQKVLTGEIDGMLYYCAGRKESAGATGSFACRGLEGDMDFVMAGMFLKCAVAAARNGRL